MSEESDPLATVQAAGPPGTLSFVYGLPDPATFPAEDLRRAAEQVLRDRPAVALQYGPEQGYGPLIDQICARVEREEGLALERPQIMLTAGSTGALDLVSTAFGRQGDVVLVEAPTYHETLQLFRDHGLTPLQIAIDEEGLEVEALAGRLRTLGPGRARFLYTVPNFQNPSGITLAADRRKAVLELAERYDLLVIEDDVYRDLAYEGRVPPSLFALGAAGAGTGQAPGGRVLRIGSFSKILAPGLRLGWLMGPAERIERLITSGLLCMGGGANPLVANILGTHCGQGLLGPHIERLRQVYRERRDVTLEALAAHLPPGTAWTRPGGGFFVWITLPAPLRAAEVAARARQAGLWIPSGDPFFAEQPTGQHLRLAFSYLTPDKIREGVRMLGEVLRACLEETPEPMPPSRTKPNHPGGSPCR